MEEESTPAEAAIGDDQKKEAEEVKEEEEAEVKEESKETSTGEAKINPLLVHVSFVNFSSIKYSFGRFQRCHLYFDKAIFHRFLIRNLISCFACSN
jgi:hypothetical protein